MLPGQANRGFLLGTPLVLINMGVEMMYILQQRLKAQSIAEDKSTRVLVDTVSAMLSSTMLEAAFAPTTAYSQRGARQMFDDLAHSSIMRLNKQSMDKLYDLMTMGWKYQVLHCANARQLLDVTLRHIGNLRDMISDAPDCCALIDAAHAMITTRLQPLGAGELFALKTAIYRFLQDRRVKVSLFVAEGRGLQLNDGTIVLDGYDLLPPGTEMPGTVRYFSPDGKVTSTEKLPALTAAVAATAVPGRTLLRPPGHASGTGGMANATASNTSSTLDDAADKRLPFPLGDNIYAKDKRKGKGGAEDAAADPMAGDAGGGGGGDGKLEDDDGPGAATAGGRGVGQEGVASQGTALLAALLRGRTRGSAEETFTPQLFPSAGETYGGGAATAAVSAAASMQGTGANVTVVRAEPVQQLASSLAAKLGLDDSVLSSPSKQPPLGVSAVGVSVRSPESLSASAARSESKVEEGGKTGEEDLLDLLDQAGAY